MPSRSRQRWNDERLRGLDELEAAHRAITRSGGGRRAASLQINQAYTLLLSSQFQGFCRELYSEAANLLLDHLAPQPPLRVVVRNQFTVGLKLDHGNPSPGNLGADFGRLGLNLWTQLEARDRRCSARRLALERLNRWRNAIAHDDFDDMDSSAVTLATVRRWRAACSALAASLDAVVGAQVRTLVGFSPW